MQVAESSNPYLSGIFAPVSEERVLPNLAVHGHIPEDLRGSFLRNGPNPRHTPAGKYHWFDGDAMIHAMQFEDGRATYRSRYVRTQDFLLEEQAGRALWKGIREPFDPGSPHPNKNTANTDLVLHAGRLLALWWQGADAYEVSLPELATKGVCNFGGTFSGSMSAHPKVDPRTGEMLFIDFNVFQEPYLRYGVADADGRVRHFVPIEAGEPKFYHDIGITENYTILLDLPLVWHTARMKQGRRMAYFNPALPARFGIIPRRGAPSDVRWFDDDACYVLHVINAHEEGDEIVLLAGRMEDPIPGRRYDAGRGPLLHFLQVQPFLYEWRLNLVTGAVKRRQLDDRATEFPRMNDDFLGVKSRYSYSPLIAPERDVLFEGFVRYDLKHDTSEVRRYGKNCYGGEVVFMPRSVGAPGFKGERTAGHARENDGWLGTFVHNREDLTTEFWILDATEPLAEPVARIPIPGHVPAGFHGTWAPSFESVA